MNINGKTIILEQGDEITVKVREQETATEPSVEQPQQPKEKGKLLYKVGLVSDIHFDSRDGKGSMYEQDLINAIDFFKKQNVSFISHCGDLCEYNDEDLVQFNKVYTDYAWAPTDCQLRFFTALGNHDYLRLFSDGQDLERLSQQFRPFSGEDTWQKYGYKDKNDYIQFFEYGAPWNVQHYNNDAGRTVKSKLNYWLEYKGDIYVFLSVDYGKHKKPWIWDWCSRAMNKFELTNYVSQMMAFVEDTPFDPYKEDAFDYQFYHPNTLIWLKDILENNRDKRVFIFMHHFLPHKAGNESMLSGRDYYSKLRLWPYTNIEAIQEKYYSGSNTLCGLEFWFLNKLNNEFKNAVWFSGHSHYQWTDDCNNFCTHDYGIVQPSGDETVPLCDDTRSLVDCGWYTRARETPIGNSAMNIHLPSLSKPTTNVDGTTLYGASEGGLMEVYENAVVVKCIRFKADGDDCYVNQIVNEVEI